MQAQDLNKAMSAPKADLNKITLEAVNQLSAVQQTITRFSQLIQQLEGMYNRQLARTQELENNSKPNGEGKKRRPTDSLKTVKK